MGNDMTTSELRALHAAATPGDWHRDKNSGMSCDVRASGKRKVAITFIGSDAKTEKGRRKYKQECDDNAAFIAAAHNNLPAILDRLERAERERDEAEERVEELEAGAIEYEKDCRSALQQLANHYNYEWDQDGATADQLREFIQEEIDHSERNLAARDARMKALGAAEWLEAYIDGLSAGNAGAPGSMVAILREEAARMRREAGG